MSYIDQIFIQDCRDILDHGVWDTDYQVRPIWEDSTPAHTVKRSGIVNHYDLSGEFPAITLRRTAFKSAVDKLLWIWQKKSNNIHNLSSRIWDSWADENGSIDKAYGYQLGVKHYYKEGGFGQVDRILYDLKHSPLDRRIMSNIYNHHDLREIDLYSYVYSMTLDIFNHALNGILNQRPQDVLTANSQSMCQHIVLLHTFAQISGLRAGEPVHVIANTHTYDRYIPMVEELLKREPYPGLILAMDTSIVDFYQSTTSSFCLENYQYHTFESKTPVTI